MSEAGLRLAMAGPAAEADLVVEPAVVEAVISELREGARGGLGTGALPLMSQAMAATWETREDTELTLRAYRRAGGVADAVNRSAQAAYNTLTSQQQDAARLVFTQLTTITLDGQFERRRCRRTDLRSPGIPVADVDAVIDVFSAQRLLVLGEDSVEISHDILLQTWKQLRDWLGDDQLDRALYSQVAANASRQHAVALSRQLAADSLAIDADDPLTARRLAVAAWRVFPTDQARSAMTAMLIEQQQGGYTVGDSSNPDISGVAFSPDGKLLATTNQGTGQTWQMSMLADPYTALCADVRPPTKAEWTLYAPGESRPSVCS